MTASVGGSQSPPTGGGDRPSGWAQGLGAGGAETTSWGPRRRARGEGHGHYPQELTAAWEEQAVSQVPRLPGCEVVWARTPVTDQGPRAGRPPAHRPALRKPRAGGGAAWVSRERALCSSFSAESTILASLSGPPKGVSCGRPQPPRQPRGWCRGTWGTEKVQTRPQQHSLGQALNLGGSSGAKLLPAGWGGPGRLDLPAALGRKLPLLGPGPLGCIAPGSG